MKRSPMGIPLHAFQSILSISFSEKSLRASTAFSRLPSEIKGRVLRMAENCSRMSMSGIFIAGLSKGPKAIVTPSSSWVPVMRPSSSKLTIPGFLKPKSLWLLGSCVEWLDCDCMALRRRCAAEPRHSEVLLTIMCGPYSTDAKYISSASTHCITTSSSAFSSWLLLVCRRFEVWGVTRLILFTADPLSSWSHISRPSVLLKVSSPVLVFFVVQAWSGPKRFVNLLVTPKTRMPAVRT
mmetsp:Transcript_70404/g.164936  ORF Transcript_70404/g.164936 Transcript_70404/m.164936 type:complete len:238 (-) Transcript_70404:467-1180(-)